jgi:hypothetical protein
MESAVGSPRRGTILIGIEAYFGQAEFSENVEKDFTRFYVKMDVSDESTSRSGRWHELAKIEPKTFNYI